MSKVNDTQSTNVPIVVTQQEINEQGIFDETSKALGWYQYFPESPIVARQEYSSEDQQMLFIVKLYILLACLFILLHLMVILFYYSDEFRKGLFFSGYPTAFYWSIVGITILLGLITYCIKHLRSPPFNLILYFVYSFGVGCVLGAPYADILVSNNISLIIILHQCCMTICTFGTIIAYKFKDSEFIDVSYIFIIAIILDVFIVFICIMMCVELAWLVIITVFVHLIYINLLLFETKLIQRGKFNLNLDEYISGALLIYIEVTLFIIFLIILYIIFIFVALILLIVAFVAARK